MVRYIDGRMLPTLVGVYFRGTSHLASRELEGRVGQFNMGSLAVARIKTDAINRTSPMSGGFALPLQV